MDLKRKEIFLNICDEKTSWGKELPPYITKKWIT